MLLSHKGTNGQSVLDYWVLGRMALPSLPFSFAALVVVPPLKGEVVFRSTDRVEAHRSSEHYRQQRIILERKALRLVCIHLAHLRKRAMGVLRLASGLAKRVGGAALQVCVVGITATLSVSLD